MTKFKLILDSLLAATIATAYVLVGIAALGLLLLIVVALHGVLVAHGASSLTAATLAGALGGAILIGAQVGIDHYLQWR
jgi:hypothetical protein